MTSRVYIEANGNGTYNAWWYGGARFNASLREAQAAIRERTGIPGKSVPVFLRVMAALLLCLIAVPAFAQVDAPNATLWASVMLKNGGQGSGTIVNADGLGVTCGHLFRGTIGGKFECYFADGKSCQATLLYHRLGGDQDIALFSIPKEEVRAFCPVAASVPDGDVRAVGYPQGVGPTLIRSAFVGDYPGRDKWQFQQYINNGQSGGGIFQGNYLVGVMVEKNAGGLGQPGTVCTAVPLPVIVDALAACQSCQPGAAGSGFFARPNRPLGNPPLGNGQIPPAAPRDDDDLPGPVHEEPIKPIAGKQGPPGPKGDKGDPGKDGASVDEARIAKIEALLISLAERKPEKGDQGPPGPKGDKGDAASIDPSILARIEALERDRPPASGPPVRETLYFTAVGLPSCKATDAQADSLYERGFPLRIVTLQPNQTNPTGLPMVFTPDKQTIAGQANVATYFEQYRGYKMPQVP